MKKNRKTFCWRKACGYGKKGKWVDTHKPEDCYHRRSSTDGGSNKSTDESNNRLRGRKRRRSRKNSANCDKTSNLLPMNGGWVR